MNEVDVGTYARRFVGGIAERTAASGEGSIAHADAIAGDKLACADGAALFLAMNPALPDWIYRALPMYEKPDDTAAQRSIVNEAFAICVLLSYEAISFHASHNYGDEALQDDLEGIAAEFGLFLLCKPGTFENSAGVTLRRRHG
jgi:hypothetical protein